MNDAFQHASALELPQLLREHLLCYARDGPLQLRESEHPASEEIEQDLELPAAVEDTDGPLDADRCGVRRVCLLTHG